MCACSAGFQPNATSLESKVEDELPENPLPPTPPATPDTALGICSRLDFGGVIWPTKFESVQKRTMALALNITGSFEGNAGWDNLAGNFDGQGISLGLNQQNLGQGTLQPMLKTMLQTNGSLMRVLFTNANLQSMTAMVDAWSGAALVEGMATDSDFSVEPLYPHREALSMLDIGYEQNVSIFATRNSASVAWAVKNVFQKNGTTFKNDWQQSFRSMATTEPYRSLQVNEATSMFRKAVDYFSDLGLKELRSLLVMYDFVVQNGGFNANHLAQLRRFDVANPRATEEARLLKLLEIRLVSVRPQFRADVQSRKRTIILNIGRVHGRVRDLQKEYCYTSTDDIRAGTRFFVP